MSATAKGLFEMYRSLLCVGDIGLQVFHVVSAKSIFSQILVQGNFWCSFGLWDLGRKGEGATLQTRSVFFVKKRKICFEAHSDRLSMVACNILLAIDEFEDWIKMYVIVGK